MGIGTSGDSIEQFIVKTVVTILNCCSAGMKVTQKFEKSKKQINTYYSLDAASDSRDDLLRCDRVLTINNSQNLSWKF
jgi:hypothetical protein